VKLAALKPEAARQQLRDRWRRDRAAAQTLRSGFPRVERTRIDLSFKNAASSTPAAQSHILHPAAQAFFAFPCPYSDCDGRFDLNGVVPAILARSADHAEGDLECSGSRAREGLGRQPCQLHVHFVVTAQYGRENDSLA
jgi:hypothetical protein